MEYILLIAEYIWIKKWMYFKYIFISCIIGCCIFWGVDDHLYLKQSVDFHNNSITVLGILVGFSISVFAILLSTDNKNIRLAKEANYNVNDLFGNKISLFESVIIGLAYVVIIQGFLLLFNFLYPLFVDATTLKSKIWFAINMALIVHTILLLLRNILDFYFIITKKK